MIFIIPIIESMKQALVARLLQKKLNIGTKIVLGAEQQEGISLQFVQKTIYIIRKAEKLENLPS